MFRYVNLVLGTDLKGRPLASIKKQNPALAAGAASFLVPAGVNLLGSVIGAGNNAASNSTNLAIARMNAQSQRETNEMQMQLAREANSQNYKMFQEQNAFNYDMWEKTNAYNSPLAQRQRLLQAGINPAAYFSGSQSQPVSAVSGSPSSVAQLTAPQLNFRSMPFDPSESFMGAGDALGRGINAYFQNQLLNEQVQSTSVDTQIKKVDLMFRVQEKLSSLSKQQAEIEHLLASKKLSESEAEYYNGQLTNLKDQHKLFMDSYEALKNRAQKQNDLMDAQKEDYLAGALLKRAQASFTNIQAKVFPQMAAAQIAQLNALAGEALQRTATEVQNGLLVSRKATEQFFKNRLLSIDLANESELYKFIHSNDFTKYVKLASQFVGESIFPALLRARSR